MELLVVAGIFFLMIAVLTPFVKMAKSHSRKIECASNLREISLGLRAYAADHNDSFPVRLGELYPNYVSSEKVFDCPATRIVGTGDKPDYLYISGLSEFSPPRETVVEDLDGNHKKSGKNILRVNGSLEWIDSRR
jgi:hypothetical protein